MSCYLQLCWLCSTCHGSSVCYVRQCSVLHVLTVEQILLHVSLIFPICKRDSKSRSFFCYGITVPFVKLMCVTHIQKRPRPGGFLLAFLHIESFIIFPGNWWRFEVYGLSVRKLCPKKKASSYFVMLERWQQKPLKGHS